MTPNLSVLIKSWKAGVVSKVLLTSESISTKQVALGNQMGSGLVSQVLLTSQSIFIKQDAFWEQMGMLYTLLNSRSSVHLKIIARLSRD